MRALLLVALILVAALSAHAQTCGGEGTWTNIVPVPEPRSQACAAYDSLRGKVLVFGGLGSANGSSDTWEWDAAQTGWQRRTAIGGPPGRAFAAMVYDSARARIVLFGGKIGSTASNDTWEMNPATGTWTQANPAASPPARFDHAMVFDAARGRTVLFGGTDAFGFGLADTWEWDGTAWQQRSLPAAPTVRGGHGMSYDSARQRIVLFGGANQGIVQGDTWEWDGGAAGWVQRSPASAPAARRYHAMTFDTARGRAVLWGGRASGSFNDIWEWDGQAWTQRTFTDGPRASYGAIFVFEPARAVSLFFGGPSGNPGDETWEWDGAPGTWRGFAPPARTGACGVYDPERDRVLLYAGRDGGTIAFSDLWELRPDTLAWTRITPPVSPMARSYAAMVYETRHRRAFVFGGSGPNSNFPDLSDAWEWSTDDQAWTQVGGAPTTPSSRYAHAMAYDSRRDVAVLFGGIHYATGPVTYLADTWEWDCVNRTWTQVQPAVSPPGRAYHSMAFDAITGRVVLFGGRNGSGDLGDTWEWDGQTWSPRPAPPAPASRRQFALTWDPARGEALIYGGYSGFGPVVTYADLWEYSSSTASWLQRLPQTSPGPRAEALLVPDSSRGAVFALGAGRSDLWSWSRSLAAAVRVQPKTVSGGLGATAQLSVIAIGYPVPSYQWRRNGVPLVNSAHVSGATGPALTITGLIASDDALYDVAVSNSCGSDASQQVWLAVLPACPANCDLSTAPPVLNFADFACFLQKFAAGHPYANCDGSTTPPVLNVADFSCFLGSFAAGCP